MARPIRSEHDIGIAAGVWWLWLVTGSIWLLFSVIVFRFDYSSVTAVSILFGIVMLGAAVAEIAHAAASTGVWRYVRMLLALAFVVIAIVAFVHPGNTFDALAAVMSFFFVIKGTFDVIAALATRHESDLWWIGLLVGAVEIVLGFWAAGDFGHKQILLVVWVGLIGLTKGMTDLLYAFHLRKLAN